MWHRHGEYYWIGDFGGVERSDKGHFKYFGC